MANIEEVGARLVLLDRPAYKRGLRDARTELKAFAADTVKSNRSMADATKVAAAAQADYAKATQVAADATTKAMAAKTAAVRAAAAGDEEAAVAAKKYADALSAEMVAANNAKRAALANKVAASSQVSALTAAATAHDAHAAAVTRSGAAVGALAKVGKAAVFGGITATAVAAYQGAKAFATYQQALEAVHTMAGLAQPRVDKLGRSLLKMTGSGEVASNPTDMANILYRVASSTSGMHPSDAKLLAMTKAAAQLSMIGGPGTDPEQTSRIIGGIMATGIKGTGSPQHIAALAAATTGAGDLRLQDFIDFAGTGVLSSANLAGVTLPQVTAMLSLLGDNLQSGQVSGHSIAHALQLLAAPSHVGMQAYSAIGLKGTQMGDMMRTKGLPAALGVFMQHLHGPVSGTKDTADYLKKYLGMSGKQIQQAQIHGLTKTEQDMILTRAFGGAKQAIPIMTVLTQFDRYQAKLAEQNKLVTHYQDTLNATNDEAIVKWHKVTAQLSTYEIELGGKVVPLLITAAHWLQTHETLVKDVGIALGVALIPATAAWFGLLATKGVTSVGNFLGLVKGTGPAAEGAVSPLNNMGKAVMGVTAAVGIWELGRATAGHGAGGLAAAGLGGAITGMVAGLAIGGPWGAAVGGAIGLVGGLASNLWHAASGAGALAGALKSSLTAAYQADKFALGQQSTAAITSYLQGNKGAASVLATAGVSMSQILGDIRSGNAIGGPAGVALQKAFVAGKITQAQYKQGADALQTIVTSFSDIVTNLDDIATISGQVSQHIKDVDAGAKALLNKIYGTPSGSPARPNPLSHALYGPAAPTHAPTLASLLGGPIPHRARGGRVRAGELYQVNELGVEMFRPDANGEIVPHSATHGGSAPMVIVQEGAIVIHESNDPRKSYEAAKQGMSDALARL